MFIIYINFIYSIYENTVWNSVRDNFFLDPFNLCMKHIRGHMPLSVAHIPAGSTHTAGLKTAALIQNLSPFSLNNFYIRFMNFPFIVAVWKKNHKNATHPSPNLLPPPHDLVDIFFVRKRLLYKALQCFTAKYITSSSTHVALFHIWFKTAAKIHRVGDIVCWQHVAKVLNYGIPEK